MGTGSATGRIARGRRSIPAGITDLGVIGRDLQAVVEEAKADAVAAVEAAKAAAVVAMFAAVEAAVRDGRVAIECTVDADGATTMRAVAATVPTEPCPACQRAPISRGSMAPLGPDGVLVQVCTACSAVSRSVDAALRIDPMREVDR
jgi:hypothetical protein